MNNRDVPGYCICTKCGYSMPAPRGVDCSHVRCPKCGSPMGPGGTGINPVEIK